MLLKFKDNIMCKFVSILLLTFIKFGNAPILDEHFFAKPASEIYR